ncbi:ERF family protein [Sphingobium sp. AN558]|uniref:ERF family protein n=1 Tax=Sphingobium sp. AN558 TaxID=3133442 RepID=UPI0030C146D8
MAHMAKEGISKDRRNQQQGYNFRGIDDVYNAVGKVIAENMLVIIPRVVKMDREERQTAKGGLLMYTILTVEFDLVSAKDGSKALACTIGEAMDSGDKSANKAQSAALKYATMQIFMIPTEGDNDADASSHEVQGGKQAAAKVDRITPAQEIMLDDKMREAGVDPAKFLAPSDVSRAADLPAGHFAAAMKALNARIAKAAQQKPKQPAGEFSEVGDDFVPY